MKPLAKIAFKAATVLVCLWIALALYALLMANRSVFPAPPAGYTEQEFPLRIRTPDNRLVVALWIPVPEATWTILFCHGNGEDLWDIRSWMHDYSKRGYQVLAIDYPGYGRSEGTPSEDGCHDAVNGAYAYLVEHLKVPSGSIIAYGRSLGSGPVVDLATRQPLGGIILDGAFMSTFRVLTRIKLLPWDIFDNYEKAPRVLCPSLSVHGGRDSVVPFKHALALYERLPDPKMRYWNLNADHSNLIHLSGESYWNALESFTRIIRK